MRGFARQAVSRRAFVISAVGSIFFPGSAGNDERRVKILADTSSKSANVGGSMTVEMWLRAATTAAGNNQGAITAGANNFWINGNIFLDRDRNNQNRSWGMSLGNGRVAFGLLDAAGSARTIVGTSDIRDDTVAHVAATRDGATGDMALFVRGTREAFFAGGPTGLISYPDGGVPQSGFEFSDPYLVLGAEKHDLAEDYRGYMSELRISNSVIYTGASITVPSAPLSGGASLYHFNEQQGSTVGDSSGNSPGELRSGATWDSWTPF